MNPHDEEDYGNQESHVKINKADITMKTFHIDLVITTTGNHDVESVKQWLTDLLSDAMQSDIERNGIVHIKVSETVCPELC